MIANQKVDVTATSQSDMVKWLAVILLLAGIVVANYIFADQSIALRLAGNIIAGLAIIGVVSFTAKGKRLRLFLREVRIELRKVIWPTRQETVQATLIIIVVVALTALLLWGVDSILLWAISFITGQRG